MSDKSYTSLRIENDEWDESVRLAGRFISQFPDRVGFRNGVVYRSVGYEQSFYVYRTKAGAIVVR